MEKEKNGHQWTVLKNNFKDNLGDDFEKKLRTLEGGFVKKKLWERSVEKKEAFEDNFERQFWEKFVDKLSKKMLMAKHQWNV